MAFSLLSGFFETLKQTLKIFFRNGKVIPSITLLKIAVSSILVMSYLFYCKIMITDYTAKITDMVMNSMNTTTVDDSFSLHMLALMKLELVHLFLAGLLLAIAISFASLLFSIATISASAQNFLGKPLTVKELVSATSRSFRRAIVTTAFTTLLNLGYLFVVVVFVVLPIELVFYDPEKSHPGKQLSRYTFAAVIPATILQFYLAVVWILALVVSVIEEKRGFEALWKASELLRGLRLKGFLLMLLFGGLALSLTAAYQVWGLKSLREKTVKLDSIMERFILLTVLGTVVGVFSLISFTVLYFEGKKIHGDDVIEMKGYTVEYSKLSDSASLISSDIP